MSKLLDRSIGAVSVLMQIAFVVVCFSFITPFIYLYNGFTHANIMKMIANNGDFLIVPGHTQVTHSAVAHFPILPYSVLMAIGIFLAILSALFAFSAFIRISHNLGKKQYFVADNLAMLRRIVHAQMIAICSDVFLAIGDQMTQSFLGRVNNGIFNNTWENLLDDAVMLVFIALIYTLFRMAMNIKQENDLTV
ncbi:DUF2975 domain-containing protein [Lentilactobacillus buchneri]|uniref:DUF2975 domain-containing protein n=1 Tax=Lentilactobacillus buchneri TaxID=1581 RepID=UPI0020C104D1|nr:DUF2975 domain-containing protein [Lentilactobacillus buchneri]